jgi:hypothetical protein
VCRESVDLTVLVTVFDYRVIEEEETGLEEMCQPGTEKMWYDFGSCIL